MVLPGGMMVAHAGAIAAVEQLILLNGDEPGLVDIGVPRREAGAQRHDAEDERCRTALYREDRRPRRSCRHGRSARRSGGAAGNDPRRRDACGPHLPAVEAGGGAAAGALARGLGLRGAHQRPRRHKGPRGQIGWKWPMRPHRRSCPRLAKPPCRRLGRFAEGGRTLSTPLAPQFVEARLAAAKDRFEYLAEVCPRGLAVHHNGRCSSAGSRAGTSSARSLERRCTDIRGRVLEDALRRMPKGDSEERRVDTIRPACP